MSRRREEAEFQRVLQLSTQQARTFAALPPYTLSSAPTDDSRDMELRPVNPASTGDTLFTPQRPAPRRSSYLLSPDPEDGEYPPPLPSIPSMPKTRVEVVIPNRSTWRHSPDPIDALDPSEHSEYRDIHNSSAGDIHGDHSFAPIGAGGAIGTDDALQGPSMPSSSAHAGVATEAGHVPSSGTESSRRSSARQQTIKEKKAVDAAERKRKRVERKAKEAAAVGVTQSTSEASPPAAAPAPKRRTKRPKLHEADAGISKSTAPPTPQRQGLDEMAPRHATCSDVHYAHDVAPRAPEECTATGTIMPIMTAAANAGPEACGGAREAREERSESNVTDGVISSVEFTSEHSSPCKTNPGSPVRSSPDAVGKDSSSPATAVTPNIARILRPAHNTPPNSSSTPGGGRWRTPRNDLAGVLAKFPGARRTGMSKRLNIVPLHASIGPGVKALPPPPPKSKKKAEEVEEDEDEDENGNPKIKVGSREWLMMED